MATRRTSDAFFFRSFAATVAIVVFLAPPVSAQSLIHDETTEDVGLPPPDGEFSMATAPVDSGSAPAPAASPSPLAATSPLSAGTTSGAPESSSSGLAGLLGLGGNLPLSGKENSNPALPGFSGGVAPASSAEMQAEMEAQAAEQRIRLREDAFRQALEALLPLKPEEIREVLGVFKESRKAAETPIVYPEPKIHVQNVSLDPSVTPPVIKLMPGHVTTITMLDQTGEPWPIQDISFAGAFDVTPPESGGHVMRVVPRTAHGIGNMSIRMVDLITPITFSLRTDLGETYYRFDARIPKYGPLAKAPIIEHGGLSTTAGGETLMQVLEGVPPQGATRLSVSGDDGQTRAWMVDKRIYVRTPLTLLSPTWDSSVRSADGMTVYTLASAPVLLLSDNGRMVRAVIREEATEEADGATAPEEASAEDGVDDGQ